LTGRVEQFGERSGGEEVDYLLSVVGAVVCGFEFAGRLVMDIGVVVKAAVGEGAAEAFVEEQEEQRDVHTQRPIFGWLYQSRLRC
jgi:hypothetical protein